MIHKTAKLAVTVAAAGALAATVGGTAYAAGVSPANTAIKATSSNVKFAGTLLGIPFTVTCTSSEIDFVTPSSGYGPVNISPSPSFKNCTDSMGGTSTITTSGTWTLTAVAGPPAQVKITIPQGGATLTTTAIPGCVVTASPNGSTTITGAYDNSTGKATYTNASIPFAGNSSCGLISPTGTMTGTYTTSPTVTIT